MLRSLVWRLLPAAAVLIGAASAAALLDGGLGRALRTGGRAPAAAPAHNTAASTPGPVGPGEVRLIAAVLVLAALLALAVLVSRTRARGRRRYVRLELESFRADRAESPSLGASLETVHRTLQCHWWERLWRGQPSFALELHLARVPSARGAPGPARAGQGACADGPLAWAAVCCPADSVAAVQAALRGAYPSVRLRPARREPSRVPRLMRLRKRDAFISRAAAFDPREHDREPRANRILDAMGACDGESFVQLTLTPCPSLAERLARRAFAGRERRGRSGPAGRERSLLTDAELRGALELQHGPLFFTDVRVVAGSAAACRAVAAVLRADAAENPLRPRRALGTRPGMHVRRVLRGEGDLLPGPADVFAASEIARLWQLPATDFATVPFPRSSVPVAPAPPAVHRPQEGSGLLHDEHGPVSIDPAMRKQNVAVPGAVEQGKTSLLAASVAEDLMRERCAVIVLDPKGDAADAAVSAVPEDRTCTLLDFADPTCGFNPLAVGAPADVIADYVVGALRNLFSEGDIRASSDRYLRNAIIAVLSHDRRSTLWDAARLLSVGEDGYAFRREVGSRVREMPELKEISTFFTDELRTQLEDSRSTTTAKLDAPLNKLARLLNSPSIKRVLLNDSLTVDFDRVIAGGEVLVVRGALGLMGAGNTSVLMQLLVGMLDAALARQQDLVREGDRFSVALKVDEAPLVLNRGFAETIALKRSAGLETLACWQTDSQWEEREVRDQLDALFAHRVYFATASVADARASAALMMAEFADSLRPGMPHVSPLARPDARLHLPRHHAIVSLVTPEGRQPPFVASTIPMALDRARIEHHTRRQRERGGRRLEDLGQRDWRRREPPRERGDGRTAVARAAAPAPAPLAVPPPPPRPLPAPPRTHATPPSYAELVELDAAVSVRRTKAPAAPVRLRPDATDMRVLGLLLALGHALSTQLHRHLAPERSATTMQRRLKRLADAGLIERMQFHRADGGGVPMCCALTRAGADLLAGPDGARAVGHTLGAPGSRPPAGAAPADARGAPPRGMAGELAQARRHVHVAAWVLAAWGLLERPRGLRGREPSALAPGEGPGRGARSPGELRLPDGRTPHRFLSTAPDGSRSEASRFQAIRPDVVIECPGCDVIVELDGRASGPPFAARLERYDHFLAGWSAHTRRYGPGAARAARMVIVCRDRAHAREAARLADIVLCAARAYPGEPAAEWEYPGREHICFAAERDVHDGEPLAYRVPPLPPSLRGRDDGARAEACSLPGLAVPPGQAARPAPGPDA